MEPVPVNLSDTPVAKARRPHHKSRTGCTQCKQRKVKCDETKPECKKCRTHNQPCSYLQIHPQKISRGPPTVQSMLTTPSPTTSTPQSIVLATPTIAGFDPALSSLPALPTGAFSMLDLETLHFWVTKSVKSFVDFEDCVMLFSTVIVEIAVLHPFLMHELLALSSLHLSKIRPEKEALYRHASDKHLATALALFQPEISNLSVSNCHACYVFSMLMFTHAWASQDPKKPSALFFAPPAAALEDPDNLHVRWVNLNRGALSILDKVFPILAAGPLLPLFTPWLAYDRKLPPTLEPAIAAQMTALETAWSSDSPHAAVLNGAAEELRRVFHILSCHPAISKLSAVMSWFNHISEDFLELLEKKIPEALLIVAYYCVALKKADNMWWMEGKGDNLLRTVIGELRSGFGRWTEWPVEQVLGIKEFRTSGPG